MADQLSKIRLTVLRQAGADQEQYWDVFEIPFREKMNVISALIEIQKNPVTKEGRTVRPPVWEAACLEEVCGSCTMNINGRIRQACTALVEDIGESEGETYTITLE